MEQIENLLFDFIRDNEIATESEIELVTNINGYSEETLNDIIHCRTGYHDVPQLYACEPENYYFSEELLGAYDRGAKAICKYMKQEAVTVLFVEA
jgi:hypothetical protein